MSRPLQLAATALLLVIAFVAGKALATGAPTQTPLTYAGTVTDQTGKPYASTIDVTVAFYDAANGGTLKCKSNTVQAEAATGRFTVVLPADCATAVHATPDLWSEVAVGPNKLAMPRSHIGALPYALESDAAKVANGLQCQGCVKVDAMLFDKDVDLQGHKITAGSLDLGPTLGDELSSAQVKTLTGGGNADALHTHAGSGGSGGQVIKFKGVTSTTFDGAKGLAAMDKQCATDFGTAKMCSSEMLLQQFPAPVPASQAWLLIDGPPIMSGSTNYAFAMVRGRLWALGGSYNGETAANCAIGPFDAPFSYGNGAKGVTMNNQGAVVQASCGTALPALCCGP